jgi:hypothetical protein
MTSHVAKLLRLRPSANPRIHGVDSHFRSGGTYVQPHSATKPNNAQIDNYSMRANSEHRSVWDAHSRY